MASTRPRGVATMSSAPSGWLICNGALVSRATYTALFAAIGTIFGAGDGVATFALPDLRGEFVRGWDNGRGVDAGRALGGAQADAFKAHTHPLSGTATSDGAHTHTVTGSATSTGGTETRPRNVALLYCIKT
jgi:microcystin-dependent protein